MLAVPPLVAILILASANPHRALALGCDQSKDGAACPGGQQRDRPQFLSRRHKGYSNDLSRSLVRSGVALPKTASLSPVSLPMTRRPVTKLVGGASQPTAALPSADVNVTIGSGQIIPVQIDTGSSDLWVPGPNCRSADSSCRFGEAEANILDSAMQSTNMPFFIPYGTGNVSGVVYSGTYGFAGVTGSGYFGVSRVENQDPYGILGLGFPPIATIPREVPAAQVIGLRSFGCYFPLPTTTTSGSLSINTLDPTFFIPPMAFEPVNPALGFWGFNILQGTWHLEGGAFSYPPVSRGSLVGTSAVTHAVADTGSTNISLSPDVFASILQAIGGWFDVNGNAWIACSTASDGPAVVFTFSSTPYAVPASGYVNPGIRLGPWCGLGINGAAAGAISEAIFGDVFLRYWYQVR
ncbi:aspartic peptidase domain-containing protein [Blyttiomyces helicus]|uniref:Aspartic peptidase domain-containing protein n=1 Tax=Blyttiomyces helicus TaxID=388810 RepID=A0A4P9WQQ2_9FUNG|nr:aspartic peptidase domain-containing protein [Blyttiomyces helicus]|eukprot:RKO93550.1 aspartic peptidase domain-containing protein [Blyttiomyces helicus]